MLFTPCHRSSVARFIGLLILAAVLGLPIRVVAEERDSSAANAVSAEPAFLDLGTVQGGTRVEGSITLHNPSDHAVTIAKVATSCGCTAAKLDGNAIAPHGSLEIHVALQANGRHGSALRKAVTVVFDGETAPLRIPVQAVVHSFVTATPNAIASRDLNRRTVVVESTDGQPFRITASRPALSAIPSDEASAHHEVEITPAMWRAAGSPSRIVLEIDHPEVSELNLRIAEPCCTGKGARRTSAFGSAGGETMNVFPRRLSFGSFDASAKSAKRTVVLRGAASLPECEPALESLDAALHVTIASWRQIGEDIHVDLSASAAVASAAREQVQLTIEYGECVGTVIAYAHPR